MKHTLTMLAGLAAVAVAELAPRPVAAPLLQVDWSKHVVDPVNFVFEGTTTGDVPGTLTSKLVGTPTGTGANLHVTFDWIVGAGARSFTARTSGIWNLKTGRVVMNGTVVDGYLDGAQVH